MAAQLGLRFAAALSMPAVRAHLLDLPSLGLVHTWTSTQDAGWARYTLDRAGVPYALVSPDDLRAGGLRERFDVLLFPQAGGDFARLVHGIDPAWGPLAYTQTDRFPSHGVPDSSPDITGGMGLEGLLELQRFVRAGGVLVTLGNSGTVAVDGGLVRHVERLPASTVKSPGSEVGGAGAAAAPPAGLRVPGAHPRVPRQRPAVRGAEAAARPGGRAVRRRAAEGSRRADHRRRPARRRRSPSTRASRSRRSTPKR